MTKAILEKLKIVDCKNQEQSSEIFLIKYS